MKVKALGSLGALTDAVTKHLLLAMPGVPALTELVAAQIDEA
jgi:hypothetical protein